MSLSPVFVDFDTSATVRILISCSHTTSVSLKLQYLKNETNAVGYITQNLQVMPSRGILYLRGLGRITKKDIRTAFNTDYTEESTRYNEEIVKETGRSTR
jgi:hypothetical protein